MDTGNLSINEQSDGKFTVQIRLVEGTIWMTSYEIARLFNVHESSINNHLRQIFKCRLLDEQRVTQTYSYTRSQKQYIATLYNLEVVVFISFRIHSCEAEVFRQHIVSMLTEKVEKKPLNGKIYVISTVSDGRSITMN